MKIAVLSDIHANYTALQTVTDHIECWQPDEVIMAGDLINRGPRPAECLKFALEKKTTCGWQFIRGNHEDYVIEQSKPGALINHPSSDVHRASIWTYKKLNFDISELVAMPFRHDVIDPDGNLVRFVHASMAGNRVGIYPETSDRELRSLIGDEHQNLAIFCVGHTHRPLIRKVNNVIVVNAGSAGLPFDGDPRPSYAQLEWIDNHWSANIVRLEYDRQQAVGDFYTTGYLSEGGPLVELVLIELQTATSQLYNWSAQYQNSALNGQISMRDAVDRYLAQ